MKKTAKFLNFDFKVVTSKDASQECIIEGYANTSDKDRVGDVVLPSAFQSSVKTYLNNPVLLENHNWDKIAGVTQTAEITDKGLFIRARISDTRPDLKTQIRERCLSTFSIGYNELDADFDESTKTKIIKILELLEISIVSVPANPEARFQEISSNQPIEAPKDGVQPASATPTEAPANKPEPEKSAEIAQTKSVKELTNFLSVVTESGVILDNETIIACCDYFNSNEETMKKDELIKLLRNKVKNVPSKDADPAAAAPAATADEAPATDPAGGDLAKTIQSILDKLNQLGDAMAQMLEAEQAEGSSADDADPAASAPPSEEDGKAAAAAAPAADASAPPTPCPKDGAPMEKDAEGMLKCTKCGHKADAPAPEAEKSVEELEAEISEIEAALETL